jgi:hypothetical protein
VLCIRTTLGEGRRRCAQSLVRSCASRSAVVAFTCSSIPFFYLALVGESHGHKHLRSVAMPPSSDNGVGFGPHVGVVAVPRLGGPPPTAIASDDTNVRPCGGRGGDGSTAAHDNNNKPPAFPAPVHFVPPRKEKKNLISGQAGGAHEHDPIRPDASQPASARAPARAPARPGDAPRPALVTHMASLSVPPTLPRASPPAPAVAGAARWMRAAARVRMRGRTAAAALDGGCGADGMEQHHGDGQRSLGNSFSSLLPRLGGQCRCRCEGR